MSGEQPHHGQRVKVLASGERRSVGEQPSAFVSGDKWQGHDRNLHETEDARMRFCVEARNRQTVSVLSCASTDAQAIASLKHASAEAEL